MDDLNDNPQKIAEDIIIQATKPFPFQKEAIERIICILIAYHQLREEIAEPKKEKQIEKDITYDRDVVWNTIGGQKKGPYCARCYIKDKELYQLITRGKEEWLCAKCDNICYSESYQMPDDDDSDHYTW